MATNGGAARASAGRRGLDTAFAGTRRADQTPTSARVMEKTAATMGFQFTSRAGGAPSIVTDIVRSGSVLFRLSIERKRIMWTPSDRLSGVECVVQLPSSTRTSVRARPLPASAAGNANMVFGGYVPSPWEGVVTGGVSSRTTSSDPVRAFPRKSEARYSTPFGPSGPARVNGAAYAVQAPPARYSTYARPTGTAPPSAAVSVKGVDEVTNRSAPSYRGLPTSANTEGGVSSTTRVAFATASTLPAKSSLR